MYYESPPFALGETLAGTDSDGNLINSDKLGKVYFHPSTAPVSGRQVRDRRSGMGVCTIALRNESGGTLYGGRLGLFTATAGLSLCESVNGYAAVHATKNIVLIDEFLATNGVADDDIFWGILGGVYLGKTPESGAAFNGDIAVGAQLVAATASSTGTSVAGRLSNITLPGTTGATAAFNMAANLVGVALSARTTGETNSDILIRATIRL